jgi:hypothetical protein
MMAASGILGEYKGSQAREVIVTIEEYERIRSRMESDAEAGYEDLAEDSEDSSVPAAYISEGQRGYVSVDKAQND